MRRTNTAIAGKETKAKLTGKAFVNFWNYLSIIARVKQVGKEYGIRVKPVNEASTSRCVLCVGKYMKMEGLRGVCLSVLIGRK